MKARGRVKRKEGFGEVLYSRCGDFVLPPHLHLPHHLFLRSERNRHLYLVFPHTVHTRSRHALFQWLSLGSGVPGTDNRALFAKMPRKSTGGVSSASAPGTPISKTTGKTGDGEASGGLIVPAETKAVLRQQEVALKTLTHGIDSYELPRSNVIKTAKTDIPDSVQLRKEVQQALVKSASVFISYLTATAHETAQGKGAKIISAQHVLDAVGQLELGDEAQKEMKAQLRAYRENAQQKKVKAKQAAAEDGNDADVSRVDNAEEDVSMQVEEEDAERDQLMED